MRRCRLPPCSRPPAFLSSAASAPEGHHRVDDLGLETLAFLFGALILGGTVKGIVGIAYPMVAVSLMSSVIEVPTAVVLVILPSVASNLWQSGVTRGSWVLLGRFWPVILPLGVGLWWSAGMVAEALAAGDWHRVGRLMNQSHASLRDDYEVSCRELDVLVELAQAHDGVLGSRMTGAGFGGATVSLVRAEAVEDLKDALRSDYRRATGMEASVFDTRAARGAQIIEM